MSLVLFSTHWPRLLLSVKQIKKAGCRIKDNIQVDSLIFFLPWNKPVRSATGAKVLMNTSYGKNSLKEAWSMEHWLWQLRWRQGPLGMHNYKERDCSHGPVAFTHGNLDAPATRPRTGTERTPNSPRPLHRCGIMLFGNAQAVFAVLRWESNKKRHKSDEWRQPA